VVSVQEFVMPPTPNWCFHIHTINLTCSYLQTHWIRYGKCYTSDREGVFPVV